MSKLTVVTAVLQGDLNIRATADSLLPQLSEGTMWLIKYSSDTLPEEIQNLTKHSCVKVIAKPDSCLYEGLNQALIEVSTEYFIVVGAGDILAPNTLELIQKTARENPALDSIFFAVLNLSSGGLLLPRPNELAFRMACPHPGAVLKTNMARAIGGFDLKYEIAADYDLLSRFILRFPFCGWIDHTVVNYMGGGLSDRRAVEGFLEEELVRVRIWRSPNPDVCARGARFFTWADDKLRAHASGLH